jgi:hypothetical protein
VGVAELHEARAFGVFHHATFERYGTQLIGLSAARPHGIPLLGAPQARRTRF